MRSWCLGGVWRRVPGWGLGSAAGLAACLLSGSAWGHVAFQGLDPGATFVAGSSVELQWIDTIVHDTTAYHLEFIPSEGAAAIPVADLPSTQHNYMWLVPSAPCTTCMISVIQDNGGVDYRDSVAIMIAPDAGSSVPDAGSSVPDAGSSVPDAGSSVPDAGSSAPDAGSSAPDAGNSGPDAGSSAPDASTPPSNGGSANQAPPASSMNAAQTGAPSNSASGGCSLGGAGTSNGAAWLIALVALGARLRRRARC